METLENTTRVWDSRLICKYCKRKFATSDSIHTHLYGKHCTGLRTCDADSPQREGLSDE